MPTEEIVEIRKALGLSQKEFSDRYKIPYGTMVMWEQGHRTPNETSSIYLRLIRSEPETLAALVSALRPRRRLLREAA